MTKNINLRWVSILAILTLPIIWFYAVVFLNIQTPLDSIISIYASLFGIPGLLIYSLFAYLNMPYTKLKTGLITVAILNASAFGAYLFMALLNGESV